MTKYIKYIKYIKNDKIIINNTVPLSIASKNC